MEHISKAAADSRSSAGLEAHSVHEDGLFLEDIKATENVAKKMHVRLGITAQGVKLIEIEDDGEKSMPQEQRQ